MKYNTKCLNKTGKNIWKKNKVILHEVNVDIGRQLEIGRLRSTAEEALRRAGVESTALEEKRGELEGELRVEREWRQSMQGTIVSDRDKINILQQEIAQLKAMAVVIIIFTVKMAILFCLPSLDIAYLLL